MLSFVALDIPFAGRVTYFGREPLSGVELILEYRRKALAARAAFGKAANRNGSGDEWRRGLVLCRSPAV